MNVITGDATEVLPLEGFDACLCDPPYGLSFMGKDWDHGVPGAETWRKVYDSLKPGGMLLAFGGTRTHHRLIGRASPIQTGWPAGSKRERATNSRRAAVPD